MLSLQNKTFIVTGASNGIGKGIAKSLIKQDANVVLAARNLKKLEEIKKGFSKEKQEKIIIQQMDVTKKGDVEAVVQKTLQKFKAIDGLINNAGQMLDGRIRSGALDDWETMIDVNIKGVLYCIHSVLPEMLKRKCGHIINIASVSGFEVTKRSTVYSATKFAVRALSTGLEKELARTGVRVTNISPGMVDTPGSKAITDRQKLSVNDIANAVIYALTQPDYVNVNEITVRPI